MKTHIVRLGIHRTSLIVAITYAILTIPFMLLYLPVFMLLPPEEGGGTMFGLVMLFLVPPFALAFTYIGTALFVWLFNLIAGRLGGVPVTFTGGAVEPRPVEEPLP
jgi:hypothetical protein